MEDAHQTQPDTSALLYQQARQLEQDHKLPEAAIVHQQAAALGNPGSQHYVANALATGVMGLPHDEAKAIILEFFAFEGGDPGAAANLGYRHLHGYGVAPNCLAALKYYSAAAEWAMVRKAERALWPSRERMRLSSMALHGKRSQAEVDAEVVQYYEHSAETGKSAAARMEPAGNPEAMRVVGTFAYQGSRGVAQDAARARAWYERAVEVGDEMAYAALGRMYLLGVGGPVDEEKALELFREAKDRGLAGLCHMHLYGLGGLRRDRTKAHKLCEKAVATSLITEQHHADALTLLGDMAVEADVRTPQRFSSAREGGAERRDWVHPTDRRRIGPAELTLAGRRSASSAREGGAKRRDWVQPTDHRRIGAAELSLALKYYSDASKSGIGGDLDALYKVAQMYRFGEGEKFSCPLAVTTMAQVAMHGVTAELSLAAQERYVSGDARGALALFAQAAETGDEVAQSNAAWLMERGACPAELDRAECERRALRLYQRAAVRDNGEAHLKASARIGDYHYYGVGLARDALRIGDYHYYGRAGLARDAHKAVKSYAAAAERRLPQAVFNLGWMYAAGRGVRQDFVLAKRNYDQAAELNADARLPVQLALCDMYARMHVQRWARAASALLHAPEHHHHHHHAHAPGELPQWVFPAIKLALALMLAVVVRKSVTRAQGGGGRRNGGAAAAAAAAAPPSAGAVGDGPQQRQQSHGPAAGDVRGAEQQLQPPEQQPQPRQQQQQDVGRGGSGSIQQEDVVAVVGERAPDGGGEVEVDAHAPPE
ncbi:hypothetical protein JKP88DRAFT_350563 [Tribonema minus]|uniref:Uncharacterized protein n=1 Tax=Tribonema minus TaxID=303371 RepID=A0A835YM17_9STRA|nr:hypothetical protein JKP88DRAFT_350563 [Tribonema minus]